MTQAEVFALANRAFDLMTLAERKLALEAMANVKYPSIPDRFMHGVHFVIKSKRVGGRITRDEC